MAAIQSTRPRSGRISITARLARKSEDVLHHVGRAYQRWSLKREYVSQRFRRHNERTAEFAFVFRAVGKTAPRTLLDIGTGTTALPAAIANCGVVVTAVDNVRDYWEDGMVNRHWHIIDSDIQKPALEGQWDMVTCISVLEHVKDHRAAMRNMMRLVRPGGHLVLTCPFTDREFVADTYRVPGADPVSATEVYICNSYSRAELETWLSDGDAELIEEEYWRGFTGKHWAMGTRIAPPEPSSRNGNHNHACFLIRRR
ncbi:MAG TPA: class I SAM-dependent methyltransferase [Steroidobacteraceae bacterium]|nr:class I SAM-dependent methyltransferase [Steroidobacteraceae bacterium]